jgi:polysaccharide export outer membrane protein
VVEKTSFAMEINLTRYVYLMGWSVALAGAMLLQGCAPGFGSVVAYEPDPTPVRSRPRCRPT